MNATTERSIATILHNYYGKLANAEPAEPEPQFRWADLPVARSAMAQHTMTGKGGDIALAAVLAAQNASRAYGDASGSGMRVPAWSALDCRAMTLQPGASGGYAAGVTTAATAIDVLAQWEPIIGAGLRIDEIDSGGAIYPRLSTAATGTWYLPGSTPTLTESDPTVGAISATMRAIGFLTPISRQLQQQSNVDDVLRRHQSRGLARETGRAVLNGTGSLEPVGILNTAGIGSVAGGSLDWADVLAMMELVAAAGDDSTAIWVGSLDVRELLMAREGLSGSGRAIWHTDSTIAGRRAYASSHMPAATLLYGRFDAVALALFGMPRIEADPNYKFGQAIGAIRLLLDCEVIVQTPSAFAKASSIT